MRKKCTRYVAVLITVLLCGVMGCKKGEEGKIPEGVTLTPEVTKEVEDDKEITEVPGTYEGYTEAPMLQESVKRKKLPEVEKRLPVPEDIYAAKDITVGMYGADVQFATENATTITKELVSEGLFRYADNGEVAPNIAKSYTVNADFTKYTIYLREGLRWSDGVLFTADDCVFFYEKLCLKEAFGESLWSCFTATDEKGNVGKATIQKLDDYSLQITFPSEKPDFLPQLLAQGGICFAPEHYFVNLMPEFMGESAALAKAKHMGYDSVEEMLRETVGNAWNTPGVPTLNAFCISMEEGKDDVTGDTYEFVRNPYYWKVDGEGKQLPYMDRLTFTRISDESQKMLLTTEGFLTVSRLYPEQMEEARNGTSRGKYRIVTWSTTVSYAVNLNLKNFPEQCPYEEVLRGIGAAHPEYWYTE